MKLKTYRAYSMAQALAAVKEDLGADAVIVQTRAYRRGGILGIGRRTVVEITASPNERLVPAVRAKAPAQKTVPAAAKRAYAAQRASASPAAGVSRATPAPSVNSIDALAEMLQRTLAHKAEQHASLSVNETVRAEPARANAAPVVMPAPKSAPVQEPVAARVGRAFIPVEESIAAPPRREAPVKPMPTSPPARTTSTTSVRAPRDEQPSVVESVARRFVLSGPVNASTVIAAPAAEEEALPLWSAPLPKPIAAPPIEALSIPERARPEREPDAMQEEMAAIRHMVGRILERQTIAGAHSTSGMPRQLFDLYLQLIGQDMSEELADRIIREVQAELAPAELEDQERVRAAVRDRLVRFIPISTDPIAPCENQRGPLRLALIGPTGVGKTTTVAKLAATFKLRHRKKVGLITSDTYRIAAVDQLRTYANIIGLPLQVVLTPAEMAQACHALRECDVILIDTAGRSQRDTDKLGELQKFLDAAEPHEVHLVLSSTASEKVLLHEAEAFSNVRADKIILTKLDEAVSFGMLVNVVQKVGKELSFVTTGQEVPDHLEAGRADRLADLVLGGAVQG